METQTDNAIVLRLREWDAQAIEATAEFRGELTITIRRESLVRLAELLRDDSAMGFTFLSDVTGVDQYPVEPRFELNYHMVSMERKERLRVKVRVPGNDPVVRSVTSVWPTANWHEREMFDLFGVRFEGHPDLRRILLPDDWEGYPLRKDFPTEGYR